MDIALRANTILCHRALHWALVTYGSPQQNKFKEALLRAYFTDGKDVGDIATVLECATEVGLDTTQLEIFLNSHEGVREVQQDFQAAIDMEISGVPCFVIDGRYMIPGAQDVDVFEQVLERVLSK